MYDLQMYDRKLCSACLVKISFRSNFHHYSNVLFDQNTQTDTLHGFGLIFRTPGEYILINHQRIGCNSHQKVGEGTWCSNPLKSLQKFTQLLLPEPALAASSAQVVVVKLLPTEGSFSDRSGLVTHSQFYTANSPWIMASGWSRFFI